uniref:protein-disulfide reductase n=1 Tax=Anthurium amnicola TaxID=1678845 RepID=A0A1D1YRC0_9ARAE
MFTSSVGLTDIEGMTIGLYFSANWYAECENFNPVLASMYSHLKDVGSKFEVVFVSFDENQESFDHFHSCMPWPAIPFSDLLSKKNLTHKFQIEGIPSLVILNPQGETMHMDAVDLVYKYGDQAFPFTPERLAELEAAEEAKYASQTLEKLLSYNGRDYVISHSEQVQITHLVGKTVGLYFSASQCLPGVKFTTRLASVYQSFKEKNEDFEIVFVSMDKDESGFFECYSCMPWLALPFNNEASKELSRYFYVEGIPSLVIIGPDGKTVSKEGRNLINLHFDMAFPFTEAHIQFLRERMDEEAKNYPKSIHHMGHRHVLNLVSESSGGGPFICCVCDEQGCGWAYQCIDCGYEIHLKCVQAMDENSEGEKR